MKIIIYKKAYDTNSSKVESDVQVEVTEGNEVQGKSVSEDWDKYNIKCKEMKRQGPYTKKEVKMELWAFMRKGWTKVEEIKAPMVR